MKAIDYLHENGLKATPIRNAIISILTIQKQPIDVQEISKLLKLEKIKSDPATIFRTMNSFAEKNMVRAIELREGKVRYELTGTDDHHHFICKNCAAIQDISDCNISLLERKIEKKKGVIISNHSLEFFGLCGNCKDISQK